MLLSSLRIDELAEQSVNRNKVSNKERRRQLGKQRPLQAEMSAGEISDFNLSIYVKRSIRTRSTETATLNTLPSSQKLMFSLLFQYIVCSINHKKTVTVISHKPKSIIPASSQVQKTGPHLVNVMHLLHRTPHRSV